MCSVCVDCGFNPRSPSINVVLKVILIGIPVVLCYDVPFILL